MTKKSAHTIAPVLIPAHVGYRELKSFQHAELVYDATVRFFDRFIDKGSRTHDQNRTYEANRTYSIFFK